jgi:FtsP/CotA-like multicopper oxidase with cupredoxin domain
MFPARVEIGVRGVSHHSLSLTDEILGNLKTRARELDGVRLLRKRPGQGEKGFGGLLLELGTPATILALARVLRLVLYRPGEQGVYVVVKGADGVEHSVHVDGHGLSPDAMEKVLRLTLEQTIRVAGSSDAPAGATVREDDGTQSNAQGASGRTL